MINHAKEAGRVATLEIKRFTRMDKFGSIGIFEGAIPGNVVSIDCEKYIICYLPEKMGKIIHWSP